MLTRSTLFSESVFVTIKYTVKSNGCKRAWDINCVAWDLLPAYGSPRWDSKGAQEHKLCVEGVLMKNAHMHPLIHSQEGSACLPVGCSVNRGGGQSWRERGIAFNVTLRCFTVDIAGTEIHFTHMFAGDTTPRSFPVASFFNSRSICTCQERTESLAHIQVPLLSFPVSPSPCTYALVCLLVCMQGKERAVWMRCNYEHFTKFSLSQSVTEVCVKANTSINTSVKIFHSKKNLLIIPVMWMFDNLFFVVWQYC